MTNIVEFPPNNGRGDMVLKLYDGLVEKRNQAREKFIRNVRSGMADSPDSIMNAAVESVLDDIIAVIKNAMETK